MALMTNGNNVYETTTALNNLKPLYQVTRTQPIMTPTPSLQAPPSPNPPPPERMRIKIKETPSEKKDDIKYVINFKQGLDVKKVFKEFYSLYGPLFVVCHIGIGLMSLGFFCSLTWFAIDLTKIVPEFVVARIGESMTTMTGTGGKFVVAYAIHKVLLPVRLGAAIYVTRLLSRIIKQKKKT